MFFGHIYAWEACGDKDISSHHVVHWTMGFQQVPVCLADSVPLYLMLQYKDGPRWSWKKDTDKTDNKGRSRM